MVFKTYYPRFNTHAEEMEYEKARDCKVKMDEYYEKCQECPYAGDCMKADFFRFYWKLADENDWFERWLNGEFNEEVE